MSIKIVEEKKSVVTLFEKKPFPSIIEIKEKVSVEAKFSFSKVNISEIEMEIRNLNIKMCAVHSSKIILSSFDAKKDLSGPEIIKFMGKENILLGKEIISDDVDKIISIFNNWLSVEDLDLILTTGGTGIGPRDVTPEATMSVIDNEVPGIVDVIRVRTSITTPTSMLSRSVCGTRSGCLIINLPGSTTAVKEYLAVAIPVIPHAIEMISGSTDH